MVFGEKRKFIGSALFATLLVNICLLDVAAEKNTVATTTPDSALQPETAETSTLSAALMMDQPEETTAAAFTSKSPPTTASSFAHQVASVPPAVSVESATMAGSPNAGDSTPMSAENGATFAAIGSAALMAAVTFIVV